MELLKAIGYPASTIIIILSLAYIFRLSFSKMLESIVSRDLEALNPNPPKDDFGDSP